MIPPDRLEPELDEEFQDRGDAEARQRELEAQGCRVKFTPVNYVDSSAPQASMTPQVTWVPVHPLDVIGGVKSLGTISVESRIISYRGQEVHTLLGWAVQELELAEAAAPGADRDRHATQAAGHAKTAIDCLFDAYIERDYLAHHLPPKHPQFSKKLELLRKRLGDKLPWRLIPTVVANPRDVAQHERIAPTLEDAGASVDAARMIVQAMTTASNPLVGPALAGHLHGGSYSDGDKYKIYVVGFPATFGLLWTGRDGVVRAGVGAARAKDIAEVRFAPIRDFDLAQHLELLQLWDGFSHDWNRSEWIVREELEIAGLDGPK